MTRARKTCSNPHCPNLQPCPTHIRKAWQGSTRRKRLPSNWTALRRRVLLTQPVCRICQQALSVEVDHIVAGDNHHTSNLQGVCRQCHATKTQTESQTARKIRP